LLLDLLNLNVSGLKIVERICEDAAFELIDHTEMAESFIQRIFFNFESAERTNQSLRTILLSIICHLVPTQFPLMTENISALLQCIFANKPRDESSEYKVTCCRVLATMLEFYWTFMTPEHVTCIFKRVFAYTEMCQDDSELLRECGEFWLLQVQMEAATELVPMIPKDEVLAKLVPLLMDQCVYDEEDDEEELCSALEDLSVPDEETGMKPQHHTTRRSKNSEQEQENENEEDEEEEDSLISSIRKCSAATLDGFSVLLNSQVFLEIFLPAFNDRVGSQDWKIREAALLAFGAVSESLLPQLSGHLTQVVPFLMANARSHPHPLVRSMSIWTLSRVSAWLQEEATSNIECWRILIEALGDANKRVQLSAATALCKFIEVSGRNCTLQGDELKALVSAIFLALKCYQKRNMLILYDLIGAVVSVEGASLYFDSEAFQYWRSIAVSLVDRINAESIGDSSIFSLIEALMALLPLDSEGTLLDAGKRQEMNFKALNLAAQNLTSLQEEQCSAEVILSEGLDDFLVASLDLLAAAMEGSHLLPAKQLNPLLSSVLAASLRFRESSNVRQSAFALFGDLIVNNFEPELSLQDAFISAFKESAIPTSLSSSKNDVIIVSMSAATNAIWCLGEFSLRFPCKISGDILRNLLTFLRDRPSLEIGSRIYFENVAVCIGRLLLCNTDGEFGDIIGFIKRVFNLLSTVESVEERISALTGYLKLLCSHSLTLSLEDFKVILLKINDLVDFGSLDGATHSTAAFIQQMGLFKFPNADDSVFLDHLHPNLKFLITKQ